MRMLTAIQQSLFQKIWSLEISTRRKFRSTTMKRTMTKNSKPNSRIMRMMEKEMEKRELEDHPRLCSSEGTNVNLSDRGGIGLFFLHLYSSKPSSFRCRRYRIYLRTSIDETPLNFETVHRNPTTGMNVNPRTGHIICSGPTKAQHCEWEQKENDRRAEEGRLAHFSRGESDDDDEPVFKKKPKGSKK